MQSLYTQLSARTFCERKSNVLTIQSQKVHVKHSKPREVYPFFASNLSFPDFQAEFFRVLPGKIVSVLDPESNGVGRDSVFTKISASEEISLWHFRTQIWTTLVLYRCIFIDRRMCLWLIVGRISPVNPQQKSHLYNLYIIEVIGDWVTEHGAYLLMLCECADSEGGMVVTLNSTELTRSSILRILRRFLLFSNLRQLFVVNK
jgi:hypothetical protein